MTKDIVPHDPAHPTHNPSEEEDGRQEPRNAYGHPIYGPEPTRAARPPQPSKPPILSQIFVDCSSPEHVTAVIFFFVVLIFMVGVWVAFA